jgi:hypothetical protein
MRLLYPSDPFDLSRPDDAYAEEYDAARSAGLDCVLFAQDELDLGRLKLRPALSEGDAVLYRGWMLTVEAYTTLHDLIRAKGARPITSPHAYALCHHLPRWYELCADLTPDTRFCSADANFQQVLAGLDWTAYFVKDHVKSLTTSRGSIARSADEVAEIVGLIAQYRGTIEGGVCVRRLEDLLPETEERYFVVNGRAHGRDTFIPPLVEEVARRIASPFFSVDIIANRDGELRLVELGDGQVSDRKKWAVERFVHMLADARTDVPASDVGRPV